MRDGMQHEYIFRRKKPICNAVLWIVFAFFVVYVFDLNFLFSVIAFAIVFLLSIKEVSSLCVSDDGLEAINSFGIKFRLNYSEVWFFGKGVGNNNFYCLAKKFKLLPVWLEGYGLERKDLDDLLSFLAEKKGKKPNELW